MHVSHYRPTLREDLPGLLLVALLLLVTVWSVIAARWVEGLNVLALLMLLSLLSTYLLAISRFSDIFALATSLFYGWFSVWVLCGRLIPEPLTFRERLLEVSFRLLAWAEQALGGGFSRDNLVFLVLLGLLTWLVSFNAVWNLFREQRLWRATVPLGLALLINTSYALGLPGADLAVAVFLFLLFALAVRTHIVSRERAWQQAGASYRSGVRLDLVRGGLLAALLLLGLAWFTPAVPGSARLAALWERSDNPWLEVQETFQRLFNAVEGQPSTTPAYYAGVTLRMGGPISLGDTPVLTVSAPEGYHYYWRSKVYDTYHDGRWFAAPEAQVTSDFGILRPEEGQAYLLRQSVQQRFELMIPATRLLYAAPQPVSFASLPVVYNVNFNLPGSDYGTVIQVESRQVLERGSSYSVTSSVSTADQASLRGAGTDYPDWVRARYLNLPRTITPRTHDLAAQIAAPYNNPFDVALAVERYLRLAITYNEQVALPPEDVEPVDYLLFERPEGYCTYYASAMAVLLRAQGIPSRVAVGFAQGTRDPATGSFVVAESDAHAWVEVYFPRYGWVEFEPTAARTPIERDERFTLDDWQQAGAPPLLAGESSEGEPPAPPTPSPSGPADSPASEAASREGGFRPGPALRWLLLLLLALGGAAAAAWFWLERRGLRRLSDVGRSYALLNICAPLAGIRLLPSDTPHERAGAYRQAIPASRPLVDEIVRLYVQEQYTPVRLPLVGRYESYRRAREAWQKLRGMVLRAALLRRLPRWAQARLR